MSRNNTSGRSRQERKAGNVYPFFPNHLLRALMAVMAAFAIVALAAALFPLPLDHIADPLSQPDEKSRILWIMRPLALLDRISFSPVLTVLLAALTAVLFVFLPLTAPSGSTSVKSRALAAAPFALWLVFLAASLLVFTGAY